MDVNSDVLEGILTLLTNLLIVFIIGDVYSTKSRMGQRITTYVEIRGESRKTGNAS